MSNDVTLVVGATGTIGNCLFRSLISRGEAVLGTTHRAAYTDSDSILYLDLAHPGFYTFKLPNNISKAFLCAGVTSKDLCHQDPIGTRLINVTNTVAIARRILATGAHVIFLSSNAVFDGTKEFSRVTDIVRPQTEYGKQKTETEEMLLSSTGTVTVIRLTKVIHSEMQLIKGWIKNIREGKVIYPFSDAVLAPLSLTFVMKVLRRISETRPTGIIQASAKKDITYESMARYIMRNLGEKEQKLIKAAPYREKNIPHLPLNTTLDTSTLKSLNLEAPCPFEALYDFEVLVDRTDTYIS